MYPGEFLAIVRRNLASRYTSIDIDCNRWGQRAREEVGRVDAHGTIFTTDNAGGKEHWIVIPADCIPYTSIKTAHWIDAYRDSEGNFKGGRYEGGKLLRGWRGALETLLKNGVLRPGPELDWYIGKRTHEI